MPIYAYKCNTCKKPFEVIISVSLMTDTAICPDCGAEAPRQITAPRVKTEPLITTTGKTLGYTNMDTGKFTEVD